MKRFYFVVLAVIWAILITAALAQENSSQRQQPQPPAAAQQPSEPSEPHTVTFGGRGSEKDKTDELLFKMPPLPEPDSLTLIGGRVEKIDRVRNRFTVRPYGKANAIKLHFDERSRIFRDGVETTQLGIRPGDRVYVDTMLVGDKAFAKNVRVDTAAVASDAHGQLVRYEEETGQIVMNDRLSSRPVSFRVDRETRIQRGSEAARLSELVPGALLAVTFVPDGGATVAREVRILATPGQRFIFSGRITHLDLRNGIVVIESDSDSKTYEVDFSSGRRNINEDDLVLGAHAVTEAVFDGKSYRTSNITVQRASR